MPQVTKEVNAKLVDGQWKVSINSDSLPLTLRDQRTLSRALLVETKKHIRNWNLKQRALQRETVKASNNSVQDLINATLTGQKAS